MKKLQFRITEFKSCYLNLYECCFISKGASRSIIVDNQRNFFHFIPNDLVEIIKKYKGKTVSAILSDFSSIDGDIIIQYLSFLYVNEFIHFTKEPLPFKKINTTIDFPFSLHNVVIDFRDNLKFDLFNALSEFQSLYTQDLQFRIFDNGLNFVKIISETLRNLTFENVDILVNFESKDNLPKLIGIINENPNISTLSLYGCPTLLQKRRPYKNKIFYYQKYLTGSEMCGIVNSSYFNTNLYHFIESLSHNTCLNGKISIDEIGLIKHCPSMSNDYGKYSQENLHHALKDKKYHQLSNITKDQIEACRDCEFRNICTDCRVYIKEKSDLYSKPSKCNYNPYICMWETS